MNKLKENKKNISDSCNNGVNSDFYLIMTWLSCVHWLSKQSVEFPILGYWVVHFLLFFICADSWIGFWNSSRGSAWISVNSIFFKLWSFVLFLPLVEFLSGSGLLMNIFSWQCVFSSLWDGSSVSSGPLLLHLNNSLGWC